MKLEITTKCSYYRPSTHTIYLQLYSYSHMAVAHELAHYKHCKAGTSPSVSSWNILPISQSVLDEEVSCWCETVEKLPNTNKESELAYIRECLEGYVNNM